MGDVTVLELDAVTLCYEEQMLSFTLRVAAGECLALIGPSGAGKSTLLALIAGFAKPSSGRIHIAGRDMTDLPPAQRPVTTVFQEHNLFAHLDVAANVGLGIHPGLKLGADGKSQVDAALREVGLTGMQQRLPAQLSGGERQRVALARCLVRRQPLLLLDEPFAALGPALRRDMLDLVKRIHQEQQSTVLLVSHHPGDACYIAPRTAFVWQGRILAVDRTERLLAAETVPELGAYLGDAVI